MKIPFLYTLYRTGIILFVHSILLQLLSAAATDTILYTFLGMASHAALCFAVMSGALFLLGILAEVLFSKVAGVRFKTFWTIGYLCFVFIAFTFPLIPGSFSVLVVYMLIARLYFKRDRPRFVP